MSDLGWDVGDSAAFERDALPGPRLHTAQTEPPLQVEMSAPPPPLLILRNIGKEQESEEETACAVSPCTFTQLPIKGLVGEVYGVQTA